MFYSAFLLGLMSSLHCVGMCGPIALALPVHHRSAKGKWISIFLYNLGRSTTYAALGGVLGFAGSAFLPTDWQQALSIGAGVCMLIVAAGSTRWFDRLSTPLSLQKGVVLLKKQLGLFLSRRSFSSLFVLGILNGLLPCGLVYMALMSSIATGSPLEGTIFMGLFGLGTLPAMSAAGFVKSIFSLSLRSRVRQWMPAFVAAVALLLIVRGLQFSNVIASDRTADPIPVCHGK